MRAGFLPRLFGCFLFLAVLGCVSAARAQTIVRLSLTPDAQAIHADGHSIVNITVQALSDQRNYNGRVQLTLASSLGDLEPSTVTLNGGFGFIHLHAGATAGIATITVQNISSDANQIVPPVALQIPLLPPEVPLSEAVSQLFITARADYLAYAVDLQRLIATQHARLDFRTLRVTADSLTLDLPSMELRAQSLSKTPVVIRSLGRTLEAHRLYVNLNTNVGAALVLDKNGAVTTALFNVKDLQPQPTTTIQPPNALDTEDIEGSSLYVRARFMRIYPGIEIHCKRASMFVSGKKVMMLPFYRLSLNPNNPNADQYVSYDSITGLGVNLPIYYMLNNGADGSIRIQHQDRAGFFGTDTQAGWSLGIKQDYGQTPGYGGVSTGSGGTVLLDRLTSPDWGATWQHSQHLGSTGIISSYFYSPDHRALSGNLAFYMPVNRMNVSFNTFGSHQDQVDTVSSQLNVDLPQKSLIGHRLMVGLTASMGMNYQQSSVTTQPTTTTDWIPGIGANFYNAPLRMGKATTILPSLSTHYFFASTGGFQSTNAGVTLTRQLGGSSNLGLSYNWTVSGASGATPGYSHQFLSGSLYKELGPKVRLLTSSTYDLQAHSISESSTVVYNPRPLWALDLEHQAIGGVGTSFNDWQVGISRAFFGRNLRLFYQGSTHQIRFEVTAGQLSF